jgi:NAD(P)-dependent dehydrogenase (short-subunit alcohol dehydrogenase family)
VTGGGGWLGADIAACLGAAGATVAVAGRSPDSLQHAVERVRDAGGRGIAVSCDVADKTSVDAMAATVIRELGGIDILVNNAAIYPARAWTEVPEDEWDAVLATNVKGYFLCARAVYDSLVERGRGRIVNLTSTTFMHGFPNMTVLAYVSSKGADIGFTRALAREVGRTGVTVNAIAPGAFEQGEADPAYDRWVLDSQCLKRRGVGADVGNAVVFLASDAAAFVTGQTLVVDGGMTVH